MNRRDFMNTLNNMLSDLSQQEREEAVEYYEDYMNDAGIGEEDSVPESFGTPENIAREIKRGLKDQNADFIADEKINENPPVRKDININGKQEKDKKKLSTGEIVLIIAAAIIVSPIVLPIIMGIAGTLFGIVTAIIAVVASLCIAGIAFIIAGALLVFYGIYTMFATITAGLCVAGAGLVMFAVGMVLSIAMLNALVRFFPWIIRCVEKLYNKIFKRGGQAA